MPRRKSAAPSDAPSEAVGYIRVSRKLQAEGHSPTVQRERLKKLAAQEGYLLAPDMIYEDHERGGSITRKGYQELIARVREGRASAVLVFMFDRFGRDGAEWLTRAREFDRLGVPIISVQEGRDEGGLIRFVRAGMAEEESLKIARRVLPARESAAKRGVHCGLTPYGYRRVHPAWDGTGRRPAGVLEVDDATAWVVREMYARYADGGWSVRRLAAHLNADPAYGAAPNGGAWTACTVLYVLHCTTYDGAITYNKRQSGNYQSAEPGTAFVVRGAHPALVSRELWERVQERLTRARKAQTANLTTTKSGRPVALASGLLRCAGCGGTMINTHASKQYYCMNRKEGRGCTEPAISSQVVHAALLAELRRLRADRPWTAATDKALVNGDAHEVERAARLVREMAREQEKKKRVIQRFGEMFDAPSAEDIAAFRAASRESDTRITALKEQLAAAQAHVVPLAALKATYGKLRLHPIAAVIDEAERRDGGRLVLRPLITECVASFTLVERRPANRCSWARARVTWSEDIAHLLRVEQLTLDPPLAVPEPLPKIVYHRRVR